MAQKRKKYSIHPFTLRVERVSKMNIVWEPGDVEGYVNANLPREQAQALHDLLEAELANQNLEMISITLDGAVTRNIG